MRSSLVSSGGRADRSRSGVGLAARRLRSRLHELPRDLALRLEFGVFRRETTAGRLTLPCGGPDPRFFVLDDVKEVVRCGAFDAVDVNSEGRCVDFVFGLPGGANLPTYDALSTA